jgi:hypothetical protein
MRLQPEPDSDNTDDIDRRRGERPRWVRFGPAGLPGGRVPFRAVGPPGGAPRRVLLDPPGLPGVEPFSAEGSSRELRAAPLFGRMSVEEFNKRGDWDDSSSRNFRLAGYSPCDASAGGSCTRPGWWCNSGRRYRGYNWRGIRRRPRSGHRCDHRWCHWCGYRCSRGAAAGWLPVLPGRLLSTATRRSVARCFA